MVATLHHLTVHPDCTLEQFESEQGALWRQALLSTTECSGWWQTAWGRHHETREQVIVWISWEKIEAARAFLQEPYAGWLEMLAPLLAGPVESHLTTLFNLTVSPAWYPGIGPTAIYELNFSQVPDHQRLALPQEYDTYTGELYFDRDNGTEGFNVSCAAWSKDLVTGQECSPLYLTSQWQSFEAMRRITGAIMEHNNQPLESLLQPLLDRSDAGWRKFHVHWDVITDQLIKGWKASPFPYNPMLKYSNASATAE
jgi:hypothetical protein